ncbi:MAG: hypothetical protein ACD_26C00020G0004 [uncultured bacterium]|nr:MAG: hypothetical protein ACD_26C00020G0004 [uncultured bacterium]
MGEENLFNENIRGKMSLYEATRLMDPGPFEMREFHSKGYFYGNFEKDCSYIERISPIIGADAKDLPVLLEQIIRSRDISIIKLDRVYPNLTPKEICKKVKKGEIKNPYNLEKIEAVLKNVVTEEVSISAQPAELMSKPEWWEEYSESFRNTLGKYIYFPVSSNKKRKTFRNKFKLVFRNKRLI